MKNLDDVRAHLMSLIMSTDRHLNLAEETQKTDPHETNKKRLFFLYGRRELLNELIRDLDDSRRLNRVS